MMLGGNQCNFFFGRNSFSNSIIIALLIFLSKSIHKEVNRSDLCIIRPQSYVDVGVPWTWSVGMRKLLPTSSHQDTIQLLHNINFFFFDFSHDNIITSSQYGIQRFEVTHLKWNAFSIASKLPFFSRMLRVLFRLMLVFIGSCYLDNHVFPTVVIK